MENFSFYSPTKFVFGKDSENQTGKLVKEFGGSKVLLHCYKIVNSNGKLAKNFGDGGLEVQKTTIGTPK